MSIVYSALNLVSYYNSIILAPQARAENKSALAVAARNLQHWVTFIRQIELLVEVAAEHIVGKRRRWLIVYIVELVKYVSLAHRSPHLRQCTGLCCVYLN